MVINICNQPNCERKIYALKLCRLHYERQRKGMSLELPINGSENRAKHPLYARYKSMLRRCDAPYNAHYSYYGGRGIKVCDRWKGKSGFTNFVEDMGIPRNLNLTLDRIDVDGDYEPSNCRWVTRKEQVHNRRPFNRTYKYGHQGIYHHNHGKGYWLAQINIDYKPVTVGYFSTKDEALKAQKKAMDNL